MASGRGLAVGQGFRPTDRYGVAFHFTHIGGLTNVCAVLAAGYSLILVEVFDPPRTTEIFRRNGATVVGGGPAFYRAFLDVQHQQPGRPILPQLRFMTGGGTPMPPSMHLKVRDQIGGLGCAHGYGMTETCSVVAMNDPTDTDDHLCHTVGRAMPGMELRVVTGEGHAAPPSVVGELRVRGGFPVQGVPGCGA